MVIAKARSRIPREFQQDQDFASGATDREQGTYQFIIGGQDDRFGVIVALPDHLRCLRDEQLGLRLVRGEGTAERFS